MKTERFFFTTTPQGVAFGGKRPKESVCTFLQSLQILLQNDCFCCAEFAFDDCSFMVRHLHRTERFGPIFCEFWVLVRDFGRKDTTKI